jgi:hypothetical protein
MVKSERKRARERERGEEMQTGNDKQNLEWNGNKGERDREKEGKKKGSEERQSDIASEGRVAAITSNLIKWRTRASGRKEEEEEEERLENKRVTTGTKVANVKKAQ